MMMLWAWAGVPLGAYNISEGFNVALRVQPQILTALSLVTWVQCRHYQRNWTVPRSLLAAAPIAALMAGTQAGLILMLRALRPLGVTWPTTLMAVLSAVLLAAGVLRHYWDIYTHRTVRGVSFLFVAIDAAGDVFSLASVFFQGPPPVDALGVAIYATEFVLWLGVLAAGAWFNLRPWVRARGGLCSSWWWWVKKSRSERRRGEGEDDADDDGGASDGERGEEGGRRIGGGVAMHDLPSSTSVFRTASADADTELRARGQHGHGHGQQRDTERDSTRA
ncbi:hypothetical protein JDV02_009568 [Purpureocillium takamizusanense]|nr:uncharacterized protein JDV02_009568 [Purpureocillium takamizusanense]UNI23768.1 hypothetical protein JDV02_009568 [Purpureocillium takamizusanense]